MEGSSLLIIVPAAAIVVLGLYNFSHSRKYGYRDREDRWSGSAEVFGMIVISIGAAVSLITLAARAPQALAPFLSPVGFVLLGLIAGGCLFLLRGWHKDLYGLTEVGVAIFTLIVVGTTFDPAQSVATGIAFMGAVYVFVRGLTNFTEGRAARR